MTRRTRRALTAAVLAVIGLAAAVLIAWSSIQVLLGRPPLLPFAAAASAAGGVAWASGVVTIAAVVLVIIGAVLIAVAVLPGTPRVLALTGRTGQARATDSARPVGGTHRTGIARGSLARSIRAAARGVGGVEQTKVTVTARRITVRAHTGDDATQVRPDLDRALQARLGDLALTHPPRLRLRITSARKA